MPGIVCGLLDKMQKQMTLFHSNAQAIFELSANATATTVVIKMVNADDNIDNFHDKYKSLQKASRMFGPIKTSLRSCAVNNEQAP